MSSLITVCLLIIPLISLSEGVVKPDGKAVLITGCDSGFGNEVAKQLFQMGFKVFATVLDPESPGAVELRNTVTFPDKMVVFKLDVTKDSDVNEAYERVKKDLSSTGYVLWGLINSASYSSYFPLEWGTMDSYKPIFEIHLFGAVRVSRVFMPLLRASKGRLTNIVGLLGRITLRGLGAFAMAKHSLLSFTDTLRQEVSRFGIKVASIELGFIQYGMFSIEEFTKKLENVWNETSGDIKVLYKDMTKEKQDIKTTFTIRSSADNPGIIVDDIIDSIVNRKPKANYRRLDVMNQFIYLLNYYMPTQVSDIIMDLIFRIGPMISLIK